MEAFLRFASGTKAYLNFSDSNITVRVMGRHAEVIWLRIGNNGYRFGHADLGGVAATVLCF